MPSYVEVGVTPSVTVAEPPLARDVIVVLQFVPAGEPLEQSNVTLLDPEVYTKFVGIVVLTTIDVTFVVPLFVITTGTPNATPGV